MPVRLSAALVAEFVGTFALCFVGILAIHHSGSSSAGLITIALAHGLILSTMVTAAMPTSGGHFNPAVTLGFLITGKIKFPAALAYIVIQLLGATVAALSVYVLYRDMAIVAGGTPNLARGVSASVGLFAEIIATVLLTAAIWGSAADPRARNVGGFAIGLTVAADILAIGPLTGASMNPARTFGPAIVARMWENHWVYWVGPICGAALAAIIYHLVLWPRDPSKGIDPGAADVPQTLQP